MKVYRVEDSMGGEIVRRYIATDSPEGTQRALDAGSYWEGTVPVDLVESDGAVSEFSTVAEVLGGLSGVQTVDMNKGIGTTDGRG